MADIYWPGTEVPIGQIKPYLHRFLDEYSGGRIHCAYAQPFRPEYTQVDYLFRLIYVFEGRFITSAPFDGRIEDREIVGGECFVGGRAHWDHVDLAHCCCKAISIIFTRYHIRLLYSEFRNGEVLQQPYSHLQYESPVLKKWRMPLTRCCSTGSRLSPQPPFLVHSRCCCRPQYWNCCGKSTAFRCRSRRSIRRF